MVGWITLSVARLSSLMAGYKPTCHVESSNGLNNQLKCLQLIPFYEDMAVNFRVVLISYDNSRRLMKNNTR